MNSWEIDVAVLLIFFARKDTLARVFESIRAARPKTLLLWQDGPRSDHPDDQEKVFACRKIVEEIDWECTVYKQYHDTNIGCDPSTFLAQKWAFSLVERCIVLEDDFLPSQSFYLYCKELLDKYKNDDRINHICGFNFLENVSSTPYDYLFAYNGSGAWASWRRVAVGWDDSYSFLQDSYAISNLRKKYGSKYFNHKYKTACRHQSTGKAYWESILGFDCLLNSRYAIIPKKNMVSNIGMTEDSTHSNAEIDFIQKAQRKLFNNQPHEIAFPLYHPKYIVPDYEYMDAFAALHGNGMPLRSLCRRVTYLMKCILKGRFDLLFAGAKRVMIRMRRKV